MTVTIIIFSISAFASTIPNNDKYLLTSRDDTDLPYPLTAGTLNVDNTKGYELTTNGTIHDAYLHLEELYRSSNLTLAANVVQKKHKITRRNKVRI